MIQGCLEGVCSGTLQGEPGLKRNMLCAQCKGAPSEPFHLATTHGLSTISVQRHTLPLTPKATTWNRKTSENL